MPQQVISDGQGEGQMDRLITIGCLQSRDLIKKKLFGNTCTLDKGFDVNLFYSPDLIEQLKYLFQKSDYLNGLYLLGGLISGIMYYDFVS